MEKLETDRKVDEQDEEGVCRVNDAKITETWESIMSDNYQMIV